MAALGSWRVCKEQRWALPVRVELAGGKACCEQAAPRAEKGGPRALDLCQCHSPGQQPPSPRGTEGTARGTKAVKGRDWEGRELGAGTAASLHLEKALGCFEVLKGVKGTEEATANNAPVFTASPLRVPEGIG